jgi:hypothetical protein
MWLMSTRVGAVEPTPERFTGSGDRYLPVHARTAHSEVSERASLRTAASLSSAQQTRAGILRVFVDRRR